ncbi:MAG: hypothetical protein N2318_03250 [Meiothermus sp.]|nr:hypothetical protein [Meiothermus sp.]
MNHLQKALAAWRRANPDGLVGRLVALHRRDPKRAMVLACYAERVHPGVSEDVAARPVFQTCPVCGGRGMLDDIPCWRCEVRT